jgi:hypothetical protein
MKIKKEINQIKNYNPKNVFFHIFIDEIIIFWLSILKNLTNPTKKILYHKSFSSSHIILHILTIIKKL